MNLQQKIRCSKMRDVLVYLFIVIHSVSCKTEGLKAVLDTPVLEQSSLQQIQLFIEGPEEVPREGASYVFRVEPVSLARTARLKINNQLQNPILRLPLSRSFTWQEANQTEVLFEVQTVEGRWVSASRVLSRAEGQPTNSLADRKDPNCMSAEEFDACIFLKNPVHHNGRSLLSPIQIGQDLSGIQTFGVTLRGLTSPNQLRNSSYSVMASAGLQATPQNGKWKYEYKQDSGRHFVAQLMAYYYAQLQLETMKQKTGVMYTENQNITVDAFSRADVNNAFWFGSQNRIAMGVFSEQEASLSAEILIHEVGHANLDYATARTLRNGFGFCMTAAGCMDAIHEGQADFHLAMMFRHDPALSQTITNSLAGWSDRDPRRFPGRAQDVFQTAGGARHAMGALFAHVLYQIYVDPRVDASAFEKTFVAHLARLQNQSTFVDSKNHLLALDQQNFQGRNQAVISEQFAAVGL